MASRLQIGFESLAWSRATAVGWSSCCRCGPILIVVATLAVMAAFVAIGDTFLVIFVGIFLALVFEFPVRFVMAKTGCRAASLRPSPCSAPRFAVTLLALLFLVRIVGDVRDFLKDLPVARRAAARSRASSRFSATAEPRRTRSKAQTTSSTWVPDAISAVLGLAGAGFSRLHRRVHDPLHLPLPAVGHRQHEAGPRRACSRPARMTRWLAVWEQRDGVGLALGDRRDRDRRHRRHDAGRDGVAARLELRGRAGRDRRAARHDPEPRRHDRRASSSCR